jgi:hypothetical protein
LQQFNAFFRWDEVTKTIQELTDKVREFCETRDWDQYHGPKDLAIGVITEVSELLEHFRFLSDEQALELFEDKKSKEDIEDVSRLPELDLFSPLNR